VSAAAEALYARVRNCTRCPLSETRTHAVPGEGPLDADIMLIGEAPGANEDREGRPFVGASGKFLTELLAAAGLRREDVYIANILKCRPPSNRDPEPAQIEACRDYLDEQVALVDPLVVVTLGRFSMAKFFPGQAISRIHGQPRVTPERVYMPMYHPAAALHQQALRGVLLEDFARLPAVVVKARERHWPVATAPEPADTVPLSQQPVTNQPGGEAAPSAPAPAQQRLFD
jgi:DNA polymerase